MTNIKPRKVHQIEEQPVPNTVPQEQPVEEPQRQEQPA